MNEQAIKDTFADELELEAQEEAENLEQEDQEIEDEKEEELSPAEQRKLELEETARSQGWVPRDEFQGNADDWVSASRFVEMGRLKDVEKRFNKMERSFDDRLKRQEQLAQERYRQKFEELEKKKIEAVELADTDAYTKINKEQQEIYQAANAPTPQVQQQQAVNQFFDNLYAQPETQAWVAKNSWIRNTSDPDVQQKLAVIQQESLNAIATNPNMTTGELWAAIDKKLNVKPVKRPTAQTQDRGKRAASGVRGSALTMHNLTDGERKMWDAFKGEWSEKEFLEAVAKDREVRNG